jgi:hypothetical protein
MKRFVIVLMMFCGSLMIGGAAQAAGAPWTVWLYEPAIGRMTQVDNTVGTLVEQLLLAESGSVFAQYVSISPNGSSIAYVRNGPSGSFLELRDLVSDTDLVTIPLPTGAYHSLDLAGSHWNWQADGERFAFGYAHESVGWEILVVERLTGAITSLRAGDPAAVAAGLDPGFRFLVPVVPVVQVFREDVVTFTQVMAATGGAPSYESFTWDLIANSVSPNAPYIQIDTDTLPITRDMVVTLSDPSFPGGEDPMTGFPIANTLYAFDAVNLALTPVTSIPSIFRARFAQAGERVVVANILSDPSGVRSTNLLVLERNGGLVGSVPGAAAGNFVTSMAGTQNGFLYTVQSGGAGGRGGTTLNYVETRLVTPPFTALSSWNSALGADARLAWVSDINLASVGPFMPWGRITPGVVPTLPAPPLAPTVAPAGVLTVGGQAMAQTTDGDVLNLRSGPGRAFARLGTVSNGALVTLLEGPVAADGLTWWRIRLGSGLEGWVVEFVDGVQTLVPRS